MTALGRKKRKKQPKPTSNYGDIEQLRSEGPIPLSSLKKLGVTRHYNTLVDWVTEGITTQWTKGEKVRLESYCEGGSIMTTHAAYNRFLKRLNGMKA